VAIIGHVLNIYKSTYEILHILGISPLDKTHVTEMFAKRITLMSKKVIVTNFLLFGFKWAVVEDLLS